MFDQLIWYFCLAFTSACACAGQPLPRTGRPTGPSPAPPLRPSRGAGHNRSGGSGCPLGSSPSPPPCSGCNLFAGPDQPPTRAFPSSFKRRRDETRGSLPCSRLPRLEAPQSLATTAPSVQLRPFARLGLAKQPLRGPAGSSVASSSPPCSLAPVPAIESQTSGDPHLCPHLRAIPTYCGWRNGTGWDAAASPLGLAPRLTPPAAPVPGRPPGGGERYPPAPRAGTGWSQGSTESGEKWDFTSFTEDAVNAVLGLLVAFLHLLPFQLGLLFLAFPKLAPQDAADGAHFGGSAEL